jgi:hypothetical protein
METRNSTSIWRCTHSEGSVTIQFVLIYSLLNRSWLKKLIVDTANEHFKSMLDGHELANDTIFADLSESGTGSVEYKPEEVKLAVTAFQNTKKTFTDLVCHDTLLNQLVRVVRIIRQISGHALLLGPPGELNKSCWNSLKFQEVEGEQ